MHESHFQFHERPFVAAPQAANYVPVAAMEQARQTLVRCVERAEGPGLVVGPAGSGKSLLCQLLAEHFRREHFQVALLSSARLSTRRALLQNILFELHLPYRGMEEGELRLSLIDHLEPRGSGLAGLLLLIDEAHTLPLRLLEEIRLISNFIRDGQPRVRLILAGSAQLEERLANPKLESLQQRIAARCYLQSLNREETAQFIGQQLRRTGGNPDTLFTADALKAVYAATDGVPRLINQVCDHALVLSAVGGHDQIGAEGIEEAWADLQQLPAPWQQTPNRGSVGAQEAAVEFGQLPDEGAASDDSEACVAFDAGDEQSKISPELRTERNLDWLDRGLGALDSVAGINVGSLESQNEDAQEFEPSGDASTQVELTFTTPANPFGDDFDAEEIVIDRYASLAAEASQRNGAGQDDFSDVAAQILELGRQAAKSSQPVAKLPTISSEAELEANETEVDVEFEEPLRVHVSSAAFNPASDPVLPEDASSVRRDDLPKPPGAAARTKRREYRTLFSTIRNR